MGPIIVNKSSSQDRLIEELQGKLGIGRLADCRRKQPDDWLTEGIIVMSKPQRFRGDGAANEVDKVGLDTITTGSHHPRYNFLFFTFSSFTFRSLPLIFSVIVCLFSSDHYSLGVTYTSEEGHFPTPVSPSPSSPSYYRRTQETPTC